MRALASAIMLTSLLVAAPSWAGKTIKVGYMPVGDCLQFFVAEDQGYFKEEGIEVAGLSMKGGAVIAPAVEANELAIGWSNTVSIVLAHAKGFDFAFLAPGAEEVAGSNGVHALIVPVASPAKTVVDLAGKTVAINTLGNIDDVAVRSLMERAGLAPSAVRLVEIPFPDMAAALATGSADAALVLEPFMTDAVSRNVARILDPFPHACFGNPFLMGGWFAKRKWVAIHPQEAAAFTRAVVRASAFIAAHPDQARSILRARTRLASELAERIVLPRFPESLAPQALQGVIDVSARFGLVPAPFNAETIMMTPGGSKPGQGQ